MIQYYTRYSSNKPKVHSSLHWTTTTYWLLLCSINNHWTIKSNNIMVGSFSFQNHSFNDKEKVSVYVFSKPFIKCYRNGYMSRPISQFKGVMNVHHFLNHSKVYIISVYVDRRLWYLGLIYACFKNWSHLQVYIRLFNM